VHNLGEGNMRRLFISLLMFSIACTAFGAASRSLLSTSAHDRGDVTVEQNGWGLQINYTLPSSLDGNSLGSEYSNEGIYYTASGQKLPSVTRWVVVSPTDRVTTSVNRQQGRWIDPTSTSEMIDLNGQIELEPPHAAVIGSPQIMRGVRMVPVTIYPLQVDPETGQIFANSELEVNLEYGDGDGQNRVTRQIPITTHFANILEAVTLNPPRERFPRRDEPTSYLSKMLVLKHENLENRGALEAIDDFITWKKRLGFNVELETINHRSDDPEDIKEEIQAAFNADPPVEYVVIIGDFAVEDDDEFYFTADSVEILDLEGEPELGYKVPSDNYFVTFDGADDRIPDIALGRILATNSAELVGAIRRSIAYEKEPFVEETDWFTHGLLTSEEFMDAVRDEDGNIEVPARPFPASKDLLRWEENRLFDMNYDDVDIVWGIESKQELVEAIQPILEEGVSIASADGWLIGSYINPDTLEDLDHADTGRMNPFCLGIISWYGYGILDNFYKNVSGDDLKGPVAVLGWYDQSEGYSEWIRPVLGTSVAAMTYNNIYRPGHLWMLSQAETAAHWEARVYEDVAHQETVFQRMQVHVAGTRVLGDPSVDVFTGVPIELSVEHPESYSVGENHLTFNVTDGDDEPVSGVTVVLGYIQRNGTVTDPKYIGFTDDEGVATFSMSDMENGMPDGLAEGELQITAYSHNSIPYMQDVPIEEPDGGSLAVTSFIISNDNMLAIGDSVRFRITVENFGNDDVAEVYARFSPDHDSVTINLNEVLIGDIDAGDDVNSPENLMIELGQNIPGGTPVNILCTLQAGNQTWESMLEIFTSGPNMFTHSGMIEVDSNFVPGSENSSIFTPTLRNAGDVDVERITAELISLDERVEVTQSLRSYRPLNRGESAEPNQPYRVRIAEDFLPGEVMFEMHLSSEDGFDQVLEISKHVFSEDAGLPFEPDEYGYICFDSGDEGWNVAPTYRWRELNPQIEEGFEFAGTKLDTDTLPPTDLWDFTEVIELPFPFTYYGEEFDSLVVSYNGWISFGTDGREYYSSENRSIPGYGAPDAQICALWQDLLNPQYRYRGVYSHYVEEEGIFIIEWSNVVLQTSGDPRDNVDFNFEIILYDPEIYSTPTDDGEIVIQYKDFQSLPGQRPGPMPQYPTIGLRNLDGSGGVQYAFWNEYPARALPIENEFAIKFTTAEQYEFGSLTGRVVRLEDVGQGVAGAVLTAPLFAMPDTTDENGNFSIENLMAGDYEMVITAEGFNTTVVNFAVAADEVTELEPIAITHPELALEFSTDVPFDSLSLQPDNQLNAIMEIQNSGNGPLDFEVQIVNHDGSDPTYDHLRSYSLSAQLDLNRVRGVVYVEPNYWVWNREEMVSINSDGQIVSRFAAPEIDGDRSAIYGLAWDGEQFWGSTINDMDQGRIIRFDMDGNVSATLNTPFEAEHQPTVAFSPERNSLYTGDEANNIYEMDIEGNVLNVLEFNIPGRPNGLSGIGWNPYDAKDMNLYLLDRSHAQEGGDTARVRLIHMDPESGMWEVLKEELARAQVNNVDAEQAYFGLTVKYDPDDQVGSVALIDESWGGGRVFVLRTYEVGPNISFLGGNIQDRIGSVEPEQMAAIELPFDVTGWEDGEHQFGLQISHNSAGGETFIPVTLLISGGSDIGDTDAKLPLTFDLTAIYPNPFNAATRIQFGVDVSVQTELTVFDLSGRQVATLYYGVPEVGLHQVSWNAVDIPSGIYLVRLQSENRFRTAKVAVVK